MIFTTFKSDFIRAAFGIAIVAAAAPGVLAQQYPTKPIRIIVGPGPDTLARLIGQKMTDTWGQQVLIDQRMGAGGTIAADLAAHAASDGYTLLLTTGSFTINSSLYRNLSYDMVRDLAPVSLLATIPFILVVHPAMPVHSVKELVALARTKPGQINYASGGNGTPPHLGAEMLKTMARIDLVHVPYRGVAPAILDVLSGQVPVMFAVAPAGLPHVKSGKLRAIAVSTAKRAQSLPDMPTVAESGYPDFDVTGWNGLHTPAKTPQPVIAALNTEARKAIAQRDVIERMAASGLEPAGTSAAEFGEYVKKDIARWAKVIREANVTVD